MKYRYCVSAFVLVALVLFMGATYAAPAITPSEFVIGEIAGAAQEAHWIWKLLASEIIAVIAGWVYCYIQNRIEESRYYKGITVIKNAVTSCYHEYVREIKMASEDGKLTIEEKNNALRLAYQKALDFARTDGFDLLKVFAKDTVLRLIEKYVGESKAKAVVAPLPDLEP